MRRFAAATLSVIISLTPSSPLWANTDPVNPLTQDPNQDPGDFVSLNQMQQGQSQEQQQLQNQTVLLNQISTQNHDTSLSFTQTPTYSAQIARNGDFSAQVRIDNSSATLKSGYLLVAFTPPGTTATRETYQQFVVNPGGSTRDIRLTNAELLARNITPGRYLITFAAFNAFDERLGGTSFGFYGNPFNFGDIQPSFTQQPVYTQQIAAGSDFEANWLIDNSGDTDDNVTLLTVITPVGTTHSKEFYTSGVSVPVSGTVATTTVTAAQLAAAGIGAGQYLVTFAAYDGFGNRLGGSTFGFFGKPLTIGTPTPTFGTIPSYTSSIAVNGNFQATFSLGNTGNAPDRVALVIVLTPPGSTNASDSKEFYKTVDLPVGGGNFVFTLSAAELAAAGITAGRYLATFVALNAFDQRIGGTNFGYFGNPLTIGTINVGLPAAPVIPSAIASTDDLSVDFVFTNSGNAPDKVYSALVFTRPGSINPGASIEVYRTGIVVPPGGMTHTFVLTAAQRAAAGIGTGDWLVTAVAFNGADQRIRGFFGNFMTIGTASPAIAASPTYTNQIGAGSPLQTNWTISNTGNAPGTVTLVVAVTPVSDLGTTATTEFKKTVTVAPGGGTFGFDITGSELSAAGIGLGQYSLAFVALRANGNRIGEFFGNLFTIGTVSPVLSQLPTYTDPMAVGTDFQSSWTFGNTGNAPANVTLVAAITPAGSTTGTKEFSKKIVVAPGGGSFQFAITAAQLSAAGIGAGDYTLSFVAVDPNGSHVGEFFGNVLRIGAAQPSIGQAPLYSNRLDAGGDFTSQWQIGNLGPVSGDVTLLTVITPVGTTNSKEFYQAATVPAGGGVVNDVITAAERASQGIGGGDFTVTFILFDANDNRIGQFFGNPLTIGSASTVIGQSPSYTDEIALSADFISNWQIGNTGPATGQLTLVVAMTPVATTDTVEFRKIVAVPPGGGNFPFAITAAERAAAGVGGGPHLLSFIAFDPAGNRVGRFFGNPLMIGTALPSVAGTPAYNSTIGQGSPLETQWSLGNSGDAPTVVTLVVAMTPVGGVTTAATQEFSALVRVPPSGGTTFSFNIPASELEAKGIGPGQYVLSFIALDLKGNRIGQFFGNFLTIGTVQPVFDLLPSYDPQIPVGAAIETNWSIGNTGTAPASVRMVLAITPSGGSPTKEFTRNVKVNPNGGVFGLEVTAADLAAAGLGQAGQYSLSFVALAPDGSPIGQQFFGNLLEIGEGVPSLGQAPAYTNHITTVQNFSSQWNVSNTGVVTAHVSFLTVITPAGTSNSKEFYQAGTIPVGGSTVTVTLLPSILAAQGIGSGSYTVTFKLLDANDQTAGQFFGNALTIDLATSSVQIQTADPIPSNVFQLPSGQDLSIPVTLPPTGSEHVSTVTAVFMPASVPAASPAAQASKPVTVLSAGGLFNFHLTAAELSLLKLSPGLYTVTFLAFDSFGRLIGDGFFGSLVEFLLG